MQIQNFPFTHIYRKNENDNCISLFIINKNKPIEALVFVGFSFYLININENPNLEEFTYLLPYAENNKESISFITAISSTDINDIVYMKLGDSSLIVLTHTFDNYTGDSYQQLRIIKNESNSTITPLNITEYEKFDRDFESEKPVDVLDLRFI